jgi:hypothetical protein
VRMGHGRRSEQDQSCQKPANNGKRSKDNQGAPFLLICLFR